MLRHSIIVLFFFALFPGVPVSYADDEKAKITTNHHGEKICKACRKSPDCGCRCGACHKPYRIIVISGKAPANGGISKQKKGGKYAGLRFRVTDECCQCGWSDDDLGQQPGSSGTKRKCSPEATDSSRKTLKLESVDSGHINPDQGLISGLASGGILPPRGSPFYLQNMMPKLEEPPGLQLVPDCDEGINLQDAGESVVCCESGGATAGGSSSLTAFNPESLQLYTIPVFFGTDGPHMPLIQFFISAQNHRYQPMVQGLIQAGWTYEGVEEHVDVQAVASGDNYFALVVETGDGSWSAAILVIHDEYASMFWLNERGILQGLSTDNALGFMTALQEFMTDHSGHLYPIYLPANDEVMLHVLDMAAGAVDQACGNDGEAFLEEAVEPVAPDTCPAVGDVGVRGVFQTFLQNGSGGFGLPGILDEGMLPQFYSNEELVETLAAMTGLNIVLQEHIVSVAGLQNEPLEDGFYLLVMETENGTRFIAFISVAGSHLAMRMLCISDGLQDRASLRAVNGPIARWREALPVIPMTQEIKNLKFYKFDKPDSE